MGECYVGGVGGKKEGSYAWKRYPKVIKQETQLRETVLHQFNWNATQEKNWYIADAITVDLSTETITLVNPTTFAGKNACDLWTGNPLISTVGKYISETALGTPTVKCQGDPYKTNFTTADGGWTTVYCVSGPILKFDAGDLEGYTVDDDINKYPVDSFVGLTKYVRV